MAGRAPTTGSQAQRERQRRYRARLHTAQIPEVDDIDRAVLLELRAVADAIAGGRQHDRDGLLKGIVRGALVRLAANGYDRGQSRVRLIRRLGSPPPESPTPPPAG